MKVFIDPVVEGVKIYKYVFRLIAFNKGLEINFVPDIKDADLTAGYNCSGLCIDKNFYHNLKVGNFNHRNFFSEKCMIIDEFGNEDILSTIFYCTNSVQEYNHESVDPLGRFQFSESYQRKFSNIHENFVQKWMDRIIERIPGLNSLAKKSTPSRIFLTHDIDTVYGALKEDGFAAIKKGRLDILLSLAMNAMLKKPDWINFNKIMDIEADYDYKSTFYWLLYNDPLNADYQFENKLIKSSYKNVIDRGWETGLHKSLGKRTINEEAEKLENFSGGNRFHYLNFVLPDGYNQLDKSVVLLDSSLGFTEQWGFRNNFGQPIIPFNIQEECLYNFLEVPMHIMDRTLFKSKSDVKETLKFLIAWFEENKSDCVLALNFHNNFFSEVKYKGYSWLYKQLLGYFRESKMEAISQRELIDEYYRKSKQFID